MARSIFLIRHAEKPVPQSGVFGVALDGPPDPQGLSVRGWQRAGALAALFGTVGQMDAPLTRPAALYAAEDPGRSHRPRDTLQPLADRLQLPIQPLASNGDPAVVAAQLAAASGDLLVCWRHRELPSLASALLGPGADQAPTQWDEQCFDLIWVIRSGRLAVVPQCLLAGDAQLSR
jgi:hypothetical protein